MALFPAQWTYQGELDLSKYPDGSDIHAYLETIIPAPTGINKLPPEKRRELMFFDRDSKGNLKEKEAGGKLAEIMVSQIEYEKRIRVFDPVIQKNWSLPDEWLYVIIWYDFNMPKLIQTEEPLYVFQPQVPRWANCCYGGPIQIKLAFNRYNVPEFNRNFWNMTQWFRDTAIKSSKQITEWLKTKEPQVWEQAMMIKQNKGE